MRAGTTWLSDLLRSYPDCAMTPFKEIHFFDIRYGRYDAIKHYRAKAQRLETLSRNVTKRVENALVKSVGQQPVEEPNPDSANDGLAVAWTDELRTRFFSNAHLDGGLRRISEIIDYLSLLNNESYVEYLKRHGVGAKAFGEITPTYGLLPACGIAEMDSLFPGAQFIFVMRDPVDRLWSHVRFRAAKAERRGHGPEDLNEEFRRAMSRPNAIEMSSYQRTIETLESVIPPDRILYLFYEKMTSVQTGPAEVRRIEAALGLDPADIDPKIFTTAINASAPGKLNPENEAAATNMFAPVYKFVHERFGLPALWRMPKNLS